MSNRELFHATMRRENGTRLLHMEQGFNVVYPDWRKQGLPKEVQTSCNVKLTTTTNLYDYMNVSGYLYCQFNQFCIPEFEEVTLEQNETRRIYRNRQGVTLMERTDPSVVGTSSFSPPHELDFSIKSPRDYLEHRHRFVGHIDQRYDRKWLDENGPAYQMQPDHPITLWVHGPFAFLRELLGVENAMVLPYEEPEMVRMMLRDHLETSKVAAEPVIRACRPDMCFVWEDCCGSTGPFISPSIFGEVFAPWYREWKSYLKVMGVNWVMLDTDGNPTPLVRQWYDAGVDCIQPWEVNAVNMLELALEFPERVMMGGIYKHMFEPGDPAQVGHFKSLDVHRAIDDELHRVVGPMVRRGGYIASLDHLAFWGTTFDGYRYYSQQLTERYGKANCVERHLD